MNRKLLIATLVAMVGCGATEGTSDETAAIASGHDSTMTQQSAMGLADEMFDFDPTLEVSQSAEVNAAAIGTRSTTRMGPCSTVSVSGSSVTVTAPAAGCTSANGVTFSGSVTAMVTKQTSSLTVLLTFNNATLNGSSVSGTVSLVTSDGSSFQVTYALTKSGTAVSGTLTVTGTTSKITTSGTLTSGAKSVTFTNIVWVKGDCYPSAGTLSVTQNRVTTTYTFTSSTPTTGTVTTGRGKSAQLPVYGSCPAGAADAGK